MVIRSNEYRVRVGLIATIPFLFGSLGYAISNSNSSIVFPLLFVVACLLGAVLAFRARIAMTIYQLRQRPLTLELIVALGLGKVGFLLMYCMGQSFQGFVLEGGLLLGLGISMALISYLTKA